MPTRPATAAETRQAFLDFFREKGHAVVPSASLVPQDDPTLLFTNAGMNQFKDVFLGTGRRPYTRAVDTQKCLRVSGKHNDLEEVGLDTYHHTFFEMLGNWSFGDYFKREAIGWAWELLVDRWGLDPGRLYATVHEGDERLGLAPDDEARELWQATTIPHDHILPGSSRDNFWMMGDTGPCGPCTEIHYDSRPDDEREKVPGASLVNADHPRVIEIWNNVFIQYNALGDGRLEPLAAKHVDTGMGFERLCAVLQGKGSNYDIDLFQSLLAAIHDLAPDRVPAYAVADERQQIAMRVVADHIRTLAFAIADGAQPGNTGRGYVIRRILRRAVRYGYQVLSFREPFLYRLVEPLGRIMGDAFPEIVEGRSIIERTIRAEEEGFLQVLEEGLSLFDIVVLSMKPGNLRALTAIHQGGHVGSGSVSTETVDESVTGLPRGVEPIKRFEKRVPYEVTKEIWSSRIAFDILSKAYAGITLGEALADFEVKAEKQTIPGDIAFLLHDTYGFPADLTALMAREVGLTVDEARFEELMQEQRERARAAGTFAVDQSQVDTWDATSDTPDEIEFVGYDTLVVEDTRILRSRTVGQGEGQRFEVVLQKTPFYAESGGQIGDTGTLTVGEESIRVLDTVKDAEGAIIHVVEKLPEDRSLPVRAEVDAARRGRIQRHHTATHLLHAALREALGTHVQQRGSLVAPDRLRFDFAHFEKVTPEEQRRIERRVNRVVLRNLALGEERAVPIAEAKGRGAMALFGEKYGDRVRVITFADSDRGGDFSSVELCGGTHVRATGEVGLVKIVSEGSVASGVRRVEAVAGEAALEWLAAEQDELDAVRGLFKQTSGGLAAAVADLQGASKAMEKELADARRRQAAGNLDALLADAQDIGGVRLVVGRLDGADMDGLRELAETLRQKLGSGVAVLGSASAEDGKAYLACAVTDDLTTKIQAGKLVGALAKRVGGGGGGRPTLATAGGKQPENLDDALGAAAAEVRAALAGQ